MRAACVRFCHCEERSDAAIRTPFGGVPGRRKGERIPTAACGRLGMTKPGDGAINHLRGRTTFPVEWCGAPGGFGTCPYEVRIGAAVSGKGRGTRPLPGGTGLSVTGKCLIPHFQFLNFSRRA